MIAYIITVFLRYNGITKEKLREIIMTTPTLEQVIEQVDKLSPDDKQKLINYLNAEIALEDEILSKAVGDSLSEDGTIDFDALYQRGKSAGELHHEFPDIVDEDGHIGEANE